MDVQDARRTALKAYIEKHFPRDGNPKGNVSAFAATVKMAQSQVADMLDGRKSFGEKVAAKLIAKLAAAGMPAPEFGAIAAPGANTVRVATRVSDDVGTYGHGVTKDGMAFAREWQKLREPLKTQIQTMVETLVAEQVRADSKHGKGPKGPKSSPPSRPNA